jgi:hypothetical protein
LGGNAVVTQSNPTYASFAGVRGCGVMFAALSLILSQASAEVAHRQMRRKIGHDRFSDDAALGAPIDVKWTVQVALSSMLGSVM